MAKVSERKELLWRILVFIVSGIILGVWRAFIQILFVVNFVIVLFTGKRNKEIANLCEIWNSEAYRFMRYLTFETNERPFPFTNLKTLGKFEK
ncbi:MAG: DUF4389 domain-containing protein [Nanoarchaeota archaeon]|nr:DUF4389 domain-containing protein [Nanoarchaeota archaeon]